MGDRHDRPARDRDHRSARDRDHRPARDRLDEYRRKRDPKRSPEPVPSSTSGATHGSRFVIHQHHARRLHWDLRLEHDGVLVSWALPRGVPRDPKRNHLAVHTEDHPLEYADFQGEIPAGEYGAGRVIIYDRGTYVAEKWRDDEVVAVFAGERVSGRYALFHTRDNNWMIHRMDPPDPGWTPMPQGVAPMLPQVAKRLPQDDGAWGYELQWPGQRAIGYVWGGTLRLCDAAGTEITIRYPELRPMAEELAPVECVLDGVVVAFDSTARVNPATLAARAAVTSAAAARTAAQQTPVQYLVVDLLWQDGRSTMELSYARRRELLSELNVAGSHWQTPPHFTGGGTFALAASRDQGLPGVVAKRLDARSRPGQRSRDWLVVPVTAPSPTTARGDPSRLPPPR